MSGIVSFVAVGAAFIAALLLVFAGFDAPVRAGAELHMKAYSTAMRTIRECGLWCALFALLGAYIVALT